jgi:hypothetical protein
MLKLAMAPDLSDLYPSFLIQFTNHLTNPHSSQWLWDQ